MEDYYFMISLFGISLWALIPGFIAMRKNRSFLGYFLLSFLISPLITMIITLCVSKKPDEQEHESNFERDCFCRKCGEKLIDESMFCRKCGAEVATVTTVTVSESDSNEANTSYVFNNAYSKIIDYIDETSDCLVDDTKLNYIYDCLYLCSAWCVFHANKDKKEQVESLRQRLLQKADELNLSVEKITDDYDAFNAHMLNYKKEVIDPEYLKDSSVENYNKLISVFVKEILNITDIKYYPEIFTDFLSCMK